MNRRWNAVIKNAIEHAEGPAELARLARSPRTPGNVRLLLLREAALLKQLARTYREMAPRGFQARLRSLVQRLQTGLPSVVVDRPPAAPIHREPGERDVLAAGRPDAKMGSKKRRRGKGPSE